MQASHEVKSADHGFWREPADGLLTRLETRLTGLTQQEAERRLRVCALNLFEAAYGEAFLLKLGKRLLNPLVALLVAAAAISGISGDFGSFFIVVAVLALSMTLDLVQEYRAEQEAEALRHSVAVHADVLRDDKPVEQPVSTLVPGDIVLLRTGDLVPADGVVLDSENLHKSILTGEPFPARKDNAPCAATEAADAHNALFAGTSVVVGKAMMLLVETGPRTRFGAIASALATNVPPTALEKGVQHPGLLILRLTIFLTLFVLLAHLASDRPAMQSILFAVALAVGLTPELLPLVMRVTLARGVKTQGFAEGHRQATVVDPRSRRHGRALFRQDRHPDAGKDNPGRQRRLAGRTERPFTRTGARQQQLPTGYSQRARRNRSGWLH
jgi:Mg2+-importing ATPase